jgi:hypothetical protein
MDAIYHGDALQRNSYPPAPAALRRTLCFAGVRRKKPVLVLLQEAPGMETIAAIVSAYELTVECEHCGARTPKTIGWIRLHRDMACPGCTAVIVLNTSRMMATMRSVERRLGDLQTQLTERIRKL